MSLPGGHMFPLERPRETAELLKGVFDRWSRATEERSA
ncbi:alpha/beta hydrolase, partial [Pseudomonas aeruginosa]|nr:alpha/beta hydrolase [Pseudomonas aeruginosa]